MARKKKRAVRGARRMSASPKYETLHDLLILKLRSLHDIERQLVKALPRLTKAASDEELREALTRHRSETEGQVERLEQALERLGDPAKGKSKVEAIRGLVQDAEWITKSIKHSAARDALLIAAARYIEHYEIAGYNAAIEWSEHMGHAEVSRLLRESLEEEEAADELLGGIALQRINEEVPSGMETGTA